AELNPHQVDALSGTLAELMAEQQTAAENGKPVTDEVPLPAAEAGEEAEDEEAEELPEEELAPDEEPQDWDEPAEVEEEETVEVPREPRRAGGRFWREHPPGAGNPPPAVASIAPPGPGGALTPPPRRNLVAQFIGEISDRGYKERLRPPLLDGRDDPDGP